MTIYELSKINNLDHVATPRELVEDIYNLINIDSFNSIWLPFDNYDSEFKIVAENRNLNFVATHLYDDFNSDFFYTNPPLNCDLVISNPPFSLQNEILSRLFNLINENKIKSFVLLLPLSTLETPTRGHLFELYKENISIVIFKKRIKFVGHSTTFNKGCCWVCYNINSLKSSQLHWI